MIRAELGQAHPPECGDASSHLPLGAVVIGRNEGPRLERCVRSLGSGVERLAYVDSGSTDESVAIASRAGAEIVVLEDGPPFTMARARNAGLQHLQERQPEIQFVHFVDGDCEVLAGWIERARAYLTAHPDVAVVCGRRRERFPRVSTGFDGSGGYRTSESLLNFLPPTRRACE